MLCTAELDDGMSGTPARKRGRWPGLDTEHARIALRARRLFFYLRSRQRPLFEVLSEHRPKNSLTPTNLTPTVGVQRPLPAVNQGQPHPVEFSVRVRSCACARLAAASSRHVLQLFAQLGRFIPGPLLLFAGVLGVLPPLASQSQGAPTLNNQGNCACSSC